MKLKLRVVTIPTGRGFLMGIDNGLVIIEKYRCEAFNAGYRIIGPASLARIMGV